MWSNAQCDLSWLVLCLAVSRHLWHIPDASAVIHGGISRQGLIRSVSDANLMFEFLLNGLVIDADNNVVMRDQELASMRLGRAFLTVINDNIPKTVPAMEKLLVTLESEDESLTESHFETLILGVIYSAYQLQEQQQEPQKQAWAQVFTRLANVTLIEIRRS